MAMGYPQAEIFGSRAELSEGKHCSIRHRTKLSVAVKTVYQAYRPWQCLSRKRCLPAVPVRSGRS